jgi:serine/threonine protein kinase
MNRLADFVIERPLGHTNYGELYLARPPARLALPDEYVVLKVLDQRNSEANLRRLLRELRAFAATASDDVVHVYEAGQDRDVLFYVRRHYPDGTLLVPATELSRDELVGVVADAARAAHALHEAGIAHRDIRPEHIHLDGRRGKLGELGLAQVLAPGQSVTGLGETAAAEYLDPTLLLGGEGTRGTDIWALGVTLHRAVAGVSVHPGLPSGDQLGAFRWLLAKPPVIDPGLPARIADIVARCIAPAAERYSTAAALADDLARCASVSA